jgi:3-hydroxy-9,10-secoandrosta-1,3,5(10)-triene-9,17-dione monooxygenase reductase component
VGVRPDDFQRHFRSVLGHFATGVAVITSVLDGEPIGIIIQSFSSLSLDPPLVLLCPALSSKSWPKFARAGHLCVNLLHEGQADLARQFARSGGDKYHEVEWSPAPGTGSPILAEAGAWMDCEIEDEHPGGDHRIVVCRVLELDAITA